MAFMEEVGTKQAIERIEAALSRIEAATRQSARRHETFKASVAQSLARLDRLIGSPSE